MALSRRPWLSRTRRPDAGDPARRSPTSNPFDVADPGPEHAGHQRHRARPVDPRDARLRRPEADPGDLRRAAEPERRCAPCRLRRFPGQTAEAGPTWPRSLCRVLGLETVRPARRRLPRRQSAMGGSALNILVAEDNAINQQLIGVLLKKWGHQVTVCSSTAAFGRGDGGGRRCSFDISPDGFADAEHERHRGAGANRIPRLPGAQATDQVPMIALTAHVLSSIRD